MVVKCCSCGAVRTSVIKLHGFPKETHLKEKWIAALKKKTHFSVTTYTRLCSQHFRDDDYYTSIFGSTILNPDAVPSKFFNSKKSLPSEPNNDSASKIFLNTEVKTVVSGAQTLQKQIIKQRISDDIVTQNKSNTSDSEIFLPDKEQAYSLLRRAILRGVLRVNEGGVLVSADTFCTGVEHDSSPLSSPSPPPPPSSPPPLPPSSPPPPSSLLSKRVGMASKLSRSFVSFRYILSSKCREHKA